MKVKYAVLIFTVIICFANTIFNGYNLDDELVTKNHQITSSNSGATIYSVFSMPYHAEEGFNYGYRPVTVASFYIEHRLFGESPQSSHAINVLLYLLLLLLLYQLLFVLFKNIDPNILLFISLLFAIHPIHTEVVASIKNRDEILSFLFLTLALLYACRWVSKNQWYNLIAVTIFASLSILSKKSSIPILLFFPLFLAYQNNLKTNQLCLLSLSFLIPIALFTYNLNLSKGFVLFTITFILYLSTSQVINTLNKHLSQKHWPLIALPIFVVLLCGLGIYHKSIVWFLIGLGLLIPLFFIEFNKTALFVLSLLIVGFFIFQKQVFLMLALFILAANVFIHKSKFSFKPHKLIYFTSLLIATSIYLQNFELLFIYLIPLVFLSSAFIHRYLPIILAGISIAIGAFYFSVSTFHLGLVVISIVPLYKTKITPSKKVLISILAGFSILISINQEQESSTILNQNSAHSQIIENTLLPDEGRKLEFVENTLVAPHTLEERIATGSLVLGNYLRLILLPNELSFYYGYAKIQTVDFSQLHVLISSLIYLALLLSSIYFLNKNLLISIGLIWYLVGIVAFSNWGDLVAGMLAERLAFIPSFGFFIFLGGLLSEIKKRKQKLYRSTYFKLTGIGLLLVLSVLTIKRNSLWESSAKLMKHDIKHLERSAQANYLLAIHSIKSTLNNFENNSSIKQKAEFSIEHFKKAISIYPYYFNYHFDLGRAYLSIENYKEAKKAFVNAHQLNPEVHFALYELSLITYRLETYSESLKYGLKYLKIDQSNTTVYEVTAYSAYYLDQFELALSIAEEGLLNEPNQESLVTLVQVINKTTY